MPSRPAALAIRSPEANGGGASASRFAGAGCYLETERCRNNSPVPTASVEATGTGSVLSPRPLRATVGPIPSSVRQTTLWQSAPDEVRAHVGLALRNAEPQAGCNFRLTTFHLEVVDARKDLSRRAGEQVTAGNDATTRSVLAPSFTKSKIGSPLRSAVRSLRLRAIFV